MKKITELTETRWRTVHRKDAYGNRERDTEEYTAYRQVRTVGNGPRFGHFFVDAILIQSVVYLIDYGYNMYKIQNPINSPMYLTITLLYTIGLLLLIPAFYSICEIQWQKTPGKFLTKTIVIDQYGNKPSASTIILRSFIRLIPFEFYSCLGDNYSYGWHDKWSNTWVVTEEELKTLKRLQTEQSDETI